MPAAVAIASLVVAAASGAYSGYVANDNAIDQKKALDEQKRQEAEAAAAKADQMREDNLRLQGSQRAALGSAGVDLGGGGTVNTLMADTARFGERDLATLQANLANRIENLTAQQNLLPGAGQAVVSGMLNFGGSALSAYDKYSAAQDRQNLLALQKSQQQAPGNYIAAQPKYSLLGP